MTEQEPPKPPARDWGDFIDTGRKWQRALIALTVVIFLGAAGAGAYIYKHKQKPAKVTQTTYTQQPATTMISSQTKSYSSPNFYLSLRYPKDWTLSDDGGGVMAIVSPPLGLTDANGQKVTGQITLMFRNSGQKLPEFDQGNATAALASQRITYSHPSSNQRAHTYMSLLAYSGTTSDGIDGIYITGDFGYKKGQAIPKVDIQKVDPIVSITFSKCADAKCSGKSSPLTIAPAPRSSTISKI